MRKAPRAFIPWAYQLKIIHHILRLPRCAVWAGMGMGKTSSTLTAIDLLQLSGDITRPTLVIAPLRVARSTWPNEVRKWAHLADMKIEAIIGTEKERKTALKRKADVYTVNYDNVPWLVAQQGEAWPYDMIVSDESTRLKGFRKRQGTKRAQALAKVAFKSSRFVELTGTPSPNGLIDLWGQMWFLDAGRRLGAHFTAFVQRWFQQIPIPGAAHAYELKPFAHSQGEIETAVKDLCITVDPKDYFDIADPIQRTIYVDLPEGAREKYDEMEVDMYTRLRGDGIDHHIEAFNAASRTMKCLQLASGAAYVDKTATAWTEVHDEKIEALKSIVEEAAGAPVLVAYHFKSDLARLKKAFPKGRELDQNPKTEDDWNAGKIPVLFAHPASAGHGLNLQDGGNIIVFFSHDWNLELWQQIRERIGPMRQLQAGHQRPVWEYYIVARNTVDEIVMARRESKREVQDLLLEAMKRNEAAIKDGPLAGA